MMKLRGWRRARVFVAAMAMLLSTAGLARGAEAQTTTPAVVVGGPCEHARYKELLKTPFDTRGDREHDYFLSLDQDCRTYKRALAGTIAASAAAYNACAHPPYADLVAAKKPADMTQREYQYFLVTDRECTAYKQAQQQQQQPPQQARQRTSPSAGRQFFTGLFVLGSLIATLVASVN
jgi:hypothetical protein